MKIDTGTFRVTDSYAYQGGALAKHLPSIAVAGLCAFTFCYYVPLASFLANQADFSFDAGALAQTMTLPFLCVMAVLCAVFIATNNRFREDWLTQKNAWVASRVHTVALAVVFCVWLEGFLLNRWLPQIAGDGDIYSSVPTMIVDTVVWAMTLGLSVVYWKTLARLVPVFTLCLAVLMGLGLSDAAITATQRQGAGERPTSAEVLDTLAFHPRENVLVLVPDALSTGLIKQYIDKHPETGTELDGFVLYENNMQTANGTQWSLSSILRGDQYQGGPVLDYQQTAFELEQGMARRFATQGYSVYATSTLPMFNHVSHPDTSGTPRAGVAAQLSSNLYGQLFLQFAPYVLKNSIASAVGYTTAGAQGGEQGGNVQGSGVTPNLSYDEQFYSILRYAAARQNSDAPTLHVHHFMGTHMPYEKDARGNPLPMSERRTTNGLLQQCEWTMEQLRGVLDALKQGGIYQSTTIVILGDHGDQQESETRAYAPYTQYAAMLVKPAGGTGKLRVSTQPTSSMYLPDMLEAIQLRGRTERQATADLPGERHLFVPEQSLMRVYAGTDVTRLEQVDSYPIEQVFTPTVLQPRTQYALAMLTENPHVAYPVEFQDADFLNGQGLRAQASQMGARFRLEEGHRNREVAVAVRVSTTDADGGDTTFEPYTLTLEDPVSGNQTVATVRNSVERIALDGVAVGDDASILLNLHIDPASYVDTYQISLTEIEYN